MVLNACAGNQAGLPLIASICGPAHAGAIPFHSKDENVLQYVGGNKRIVPEYCLSEVSVDAFVLFLRDVVLFVDFSSVGAFRRGCQLGVAGGHGRDSEKLLLLCVLRWRVGHILMFCQGLDDVVCDGREACRGLCRICC